ncbi:MAG: Inositol 2-dehydrogenase/D-chiro-inositol 3-dehydrogenase [Prosthecobacter sp.]|nr:Inositol 2-dehydrogenase/D-chiro-inositol 3-dehydrogenase [Prosthecobacter sp.]
MKKHLRNTPTRRDFIATGAAVLGFNIIPRHVLGAPGVPPPSEKLNIGCVGIGGQGGGVTRDLATFANVHIAALCDVERKHETTMAKAYPGRPFYTDYREMLSAEKGLDAVMVGTPDHWHAPISIAAMKLGKHVYCEKPLAHTIEETRIMAQVAAETKVVTQMGNTGHASEGLRLTKEWIDAGAIGEIGEVHVWSDRPGTFWDSQGRTRPTEKLPVPDTLDWNQWQGSAPEHDYHPLYVPRKWRGWFDYGCGALGDMMVHNADPAWFALDLGAPIAIEAQTSETNADSFPLWSVVTWHFAAKSGRGPVRLTWHDGGKRPAPPPGFDPARRIGDNGILFLGDKGSIIAPGWCGTPRIVPESQMRSFKLPPRTLARSPGHREEWVAACLAGRPEDAKANFAYAAPYTEALLTGVLPIRLGKRIEWDSGTMKATNAPEAEALIRKSYRKGFELPV